MSSEPERDIEKQIRSYAEQRREEAGERFSLHPAARQSLHAEVTEAHPKEAADPTPMSVLQSEATIGFWTLFRRQFALVCTLAVVLTGLGFAWVKYGKPEETEMAETETIVVPSSLIAQPPVPMEMVHLDDEPEMAPDASGATATEALPELPLIATSPASTATDVPTPRSAPIKAPAESAAPPIETPLTAPDPNRPLQRFVTASIPRNYRRNFNSPAPVDLLSSFQVQQVGRQLLLVDSDGSTFAGEVDPPDNGADSLKFRVSGTSRALNQHVIITGALSAAGAAAASSPALVNLRVANESRLPLDQIRIDARAVIGNESRPISATPVSGQ